MQSIEFTRIANDTNGNPRYVIHFLQMLTQEESDAPPSLTGRDGLTLSQKYAIACKRANKIGGRKYHTKRYGGGIVFQSYSLAELRNHINEATGREYTDHTVTR